MVRWSSPSGSKRGSKERGRELEKFRSSELRVVRSGVVARGPFIALQGRFVAGEGWFAVVGDEDDAIYVGSIVTLQKTPWNGWV